MATAIPDLHPVQKIIDAFGGHVKIAVGLSTAEERFSTGTIGAWKHRCSIPVVYWPRLIALADQMRIEGVTNDTLVAAHTCQAAA